MYLSYNQFSTPIKLIQVIVIIAILLFILSDDNWHEDEESNTVVSLSQCSLLSLNNLNTECSSSSSKFRELQPRKRLELVLIRTLKET